MGEASVESETDVCWKLVSLSVGKGPCRYLLSSSIILTVISQTNCTVIDSVTHNLGHRKATQAFYPLHYDFTKQFLVFEYG